MSLFGTSPDQAPTSGRAESKSTLFVDDEAPANNKSSGGIFHDENTNGDSPWGMPSAKRNSRGDMIKSLLPAAVVPAEYVDAFDALSNSEFGNGRGRVSLDGVRAAVKSSGIPQAKQDEALKLVTGDVRVESLERNEFNVVLALVGLAQEKEEMSLDSVDERRKNLPRPSVPFLKQLTSAKSIRRANAKPDSAHNESSTPTSSPGKSRKLDKDTLENLESDPWASPATSRALTNPVHNNATPLGNPVTAARPTRPPFMEANGTTSSITTRSDAAPGSHNSLLGSTIGGSSGADSGSAWGGLGAASDGQDGINGGGFAAADNDEQTLTGSMGRSIGNRRQVASSGLEEVVTIALLPEKEGMFLLKHHNYEVKCARRGSSVVRRFSDFVWLLDCLHKRYPFRQLPLLPPKRVAVNGRHLAADASFMEKRRRGLIRFSNALVRHPVLGKEQLATMFFTVPTELAIWRKQASVSVQEEFEGRTLPPELEESLPTNLGDIFDTVRSGVRQSAEHYIGLCNLMERLTKRNQGIAADYLRFSQALTRLTEASESTYAIDTNDVPLLNEGINSVAKHLTFSQGLLEDESRAWDLGVLEDLKKQRDALVGVRDLFDRRDRFAKDNIPQLERRIETNENKLAGLLSGTGGKPGEQEKLEQAVRSDKQSIIDQHARGVFIRECIRDELVYFQQSQYHISRLHQDWSQERVKYAELQADNWRRLSDQVEHMPVGE